MAKFVQVRDYNDFDKIKDYMSKNRKNNYYITPKLMLKLLNSLRYRCVIGLSMDDVKISEHDKIDLMTFPVYNKIFQADAFRIEAIKSYYLRRVPNEIEYESVIFGLKEEDQKISCTEKLKI